ncbi:hypothetical protein V8E36_006182 [Tilletia maclaganii]
MSVPLSSVASVEQKPPSVRLKRVAVTSCDSCRLRKLKCNAKELPPGSTCGSCAKHSWKCTFEDCKESLNRPTTRMRHKIHRNPSLSQTELPLYTTLPAAGDQITSNASFQPLVGAQQLQTSFAPTQAVTLQDVGGIWPGFPGPSTEPISMPHALQSTLTAAPLYQNNAVVNGSLPHVTQSSIAIDFMSPSLTAFGLPSVITDIRTGQACAMPRALLTQYLLNRFYSDPTANAAIVPMRDLFRRFHGGFSDSLPDHLLQTILAVTAFLPSTKEPELLAWRAHAWTSAVNAVQDRLRSRVTADLPLVQALLLLGNSWIGDPEDHERAIILEMAFRLGLSIGLHAHETAGPDPHSRSVRTLLFWNMYVTDRILLVATGRPLIIGRSAHNIPLPTALDAAVMAVGTPAGATAAATEPALIHRQLLSFIALANILEETQAVLQNLRESAPSTLQELLQRILPVELSLETWCKTNKLLLRETAAMHGPVCQNLTETMVAQLHICQLQLYQSPIRFEIEHATALPIQFDPANSKSLTACVESAWYLVQQPMVNRDPTAAMQSLLPGSQPAMHFNITNLAVLRAVQFFRLLSGTWSEWRAGRGLEEYTPRNAVEFAVAAQGPSGDVGVLQQQQAVAQQRMTVQPHEALPEGYHFEPQPPYQAVPAGIPIAQPFQTVASVNPSASNMFLNGMQGGNGPPPQPAAVNNAFSGLTSEGSAGLLGPDQRRHSVFAPIRTPSANEPTPSVSGLDATRRQSESAAGVRDARKPEPLGLHKLAASQAGGSTLAAKRKREVTFIDTDTGRTNGNKKAKADETVTTTDGTSNVRSSKAHGSTAGSLDVPPRTARLDTATLESFAFPLTPARFLFDASEIDLSLWNWSPLEEQNTQAVSGGKGSQSEGQTSSAPGESSKDLKAQATSANTSQGQNPAEGSTERAGVEQPGRKGSQPAQPATSVPTAPPEAGLPNPAIALTDYAQDTLAPPDMPFTPSLGNFGATAAMMAPLRPDYMHNFQTEPPTTDALQSPSRAFVHLNDGLDLSAFGLKGLEGLDPLHGIFSSLYASDVMTGLSALGSGRPSGNEAGPSATVEGAAGLAPGAAL